MFFALLITAAIMASLYMLALSTTGAGIDFSIWMCLGLWSRIRGFLFVLGFGMEALVYAVHLLIRLFSWYDIDSQKYSFPVTMIYFILYSTTLCYVYVS
ncbi:hypothetical protein F4820DRAFT_411452, partial [Hypoxylon rubiginosum]